MHKLHLIEKPMANKSVLVKLGTWARVIWSQVVFVGPTFFLRHRRSVLMPLARRVRRDVLVI